MNRRRSRRIRSRRKTVVPDSHTILPRIRFIIARDRRPIECLRDPTGFEEFIFRPMDAGIAPLVEIRRCGDGKTGSVRVRAPTCLG